MAEVVASRALRGIGNALNLTGERSAPDGIELALPAQPVHDLTPYTRYGSAHVFGRFNDGWVTFALKDVVSAAGFATTNVPDWSALVSGAFGVSPGRLSRMALWVYEITLQATTTAIADLGSSSVRIAVPVGISSGSGANDAHLVWASDGSKDFVLISALIAQCINRRPLRQPFQWAAGANAKFTVQNVNAQAITWDFAFLCRMLPMGQAPLP